MQRMNVADRMKNGKRLTVGGGPKADHNTKGRTKRPTGSRRGTHTGNTQTHRSQFTVLSSEKPEIIWMCMRRFFFPFIAHRKV